ncbi:MAG: teichoic acid ABC transporter ATP-binding protein [Acidobacteria bacterium]|nr:MAG: teichoic acid ABC transporter ATP-binding protein [Acidobacteriota bacterium]
MRATRICFQNVVQCFRVIRERPDTLREAFAHLFRSRMDYYNFEALQGVSFAIHDGEVVGIIGRNGSGKSTILKIIAGVYRPTSGIVQISGKVAALIELGAGFHPDLTGRENIVLNGLLLGLSRRKMQALEKQILHFAEVGEFIDSPIKQYSSGMFMRLGFAIATEVDPDILLIDEILAVGDAAFQQKCSARIDDFRQRGKTIVFVSHDMGAIRQLCRRVLLVHNGVLLGDGPADQIVARYEELLHKPGDTVISAPAIP